MSDSPARPRLPGRPGNSGSPRTATWLALFGLGIVIAGLIGLVAMVLPEIRVIILLVGAFGFVFGGHYLVWGYWLQKRLSRKNGERPVQFWKNAPPPAVFPVDDRD